MYIFNMNTYHSRLRGCCDTDFFFNVRYGFCGGGRFGGGKRPCFIHTPYQLLITGYYFLYSKMHISIHAAVFCDLDHSLLREGGGGGGKGGFEHFGYVFKFYSRY